MQKDYLGMMRRCLGEIQMLRKRIEVLEPKAHAYDTLSVVLDLLPRRSQGEGEDVAWLLKREIEKVEAEAKKEQG